jgi:hypothetical protein
MQQMAIDNVERFVAVATKIVVERFVAPATTNKAEAAAAGPVGFKLG